MHDIMKIVKSLEESRLLIKGISYTIENVQKSKKVDFLAFFYYISCKYDRKYDKW